MQERSFTALRALVGLMSSAPDDDATHCEDDHDGHDDYNIDNEDEDEDED